MTDEPRIDALVFDLDDTLFPERSHSIGALADVARAFEAELAPPFPLHERLCELLDAPSRTRTFDTVLAELGREDAAVLVPRMIEVYRAHRPQIALYPDADAALKRWRGRVPLALITDGWPEIQEAKIDALSVRDTFATIVITGQWGVEFFKPHPRAYRHVMTTLGAEASRCVYVGDNVAKDFVAPRQLGWQTIRIRRSDGLYEGMAVAENGHPQVTVASLDELDGALNAISK